MTAPRAKDALFCFATRVFNFSTRKTIIWTPLCFVQGDKNGMGCFVRGGKSSWDVLSRVSKMAWDVLSWDVLSSSHGINAR